MGNGSRFANEGDSPTEVRSNSETPPVWPYQLFAGSSFKLYAHQQCISSIQLAICHLLLFVALHVFPLLCFQPIFYFPIRAYRLHCRRLRDRQYCCVFWSFGRFFSSNIVPNYRSCVLESSLLDLFLTLTPASPS